MAAVRIQEAASLRLDEIYRYTRDRWGTEQADRYITGLFEAFDGIESHAVMSKPVPAAFGVEGYYFRYERHFVHWRRLSNNDVGIVTILHERMHQIDRFGEDFGE
jgi:plasmid stabilization system protein ParE